jgi:DNA-directed RNA polymerase II subunit RPB7
LDAVVTKVNKMGFFAEVGPLPVFVSKHAIPADMIFDQNSNPASYVSQVTDEQPIRIRTDSEVRLRIVGTHFDVNEIRAIGTIRDDYLGVIT